MAIRIWKVVITKEKGKRMTHINHDKDMILWDFANQGISCFVAFRSGLLVGKSGLKIQAKKLISKETNKSE